MDIPLVGRDDVDHLLRNSKHDRMLVGSPGSGKTALLARLAAEGLGAFLVHNDPAALANAIRQQRPQYVFVDDMHEPIEDVRLLAHLREEIGGEYRIIVTGWGIDRALFDSLGLTESDVVTLEQLTRNEIVSVIESLGIMGPRDLVRELVNQVEGNPGLAVGRVDSSI